MSFDPDSRRFVWLIVFCAIFGVAFGWLSASIAGFFWSMLAQEDVPWGLFVLLWTVGAVIFFAWPMSIAERARANRAQRALMKERIGDIDFEPPSFRRFMRGRFTSAEQGTSKIHEPPPGPGAELHNVIPPPKPSGVRRIFGSSSPTAEERMAHYLNVETLRKELDAKEPKEPEPPK